MKHAKNYCRNPDGRRPEPFCYTLPLNSGLGVPLVEEACAVPRCINNKNFDQKINGGCKNFCFVKFKNFYMYIIKNLAKVQNDIGVSPPPLLDSLTNVWRSLSSQQWQLIAMSGLGGVLLLLLLLLICCLCCCCWRRGRNQKSSSCKGASSNSGINIESASSILSSSNIKKGNPNFGRIGNGCGGSSLANR